MRLCVCIDLFVSHVRRSAFAFMPMNELSILSKAGSVILSTMIVYAGYLAREKGDPAV